MAWWDTNTEHGILDVSLPPKSHLIMGDTFPRLELTPADKHNEMERERALLSPVFEEQLGSSTMPALVVHVDIRFTDPTIQSRYCRRYASSSGFQATTRICRGFVRRIERCSEEFITRKDSGALEMFKDDTYERKPQRFEMTFRVMRRGVGEWAERTYRSYQKHPLTVSHTKEVMLSVHWMIGLFLRRHDQNFQWLDCPTPELDSEGSETAVPSRDGPLSTLSVPRSRFVETSQAFEFVPGYSIEIYFRSRNPHRRVPTFEKRTRVTSAQTTPLTLFLSEDMLWKALQFANQALDSKKREFDDHLRDHRELYSTHLEDDTFELSLKVQNHLGPAYNHVHRSIKSKLALFRDRDAQDCGTFLSRIEGYLSHVRDEADALLNGMNDFEVRIAELKGVGWTVREPAKFTLGPSASYGRRTIQAALERIQTGVGDVIRGHNIAIHVNAHKRGHLVLDKAIVAHEKHGNAKETFASREDEQAAIVERLKAQVQKDMDKIFEDSCSIDDIPEYEDDYFVTRPVTPVTPLQPEQAVFDSPSRRVDEGKRLLPKPRAVDTMWTPVAARPVTPVTPLQPEQAVFDEPSPAPSPSSAKSSPAKRPALGVLQSSPKPRARRLFSLSRRSTESVRSIDYLKKAARDLFSHDTKSGSVISEQTSEPHGTEPPVPEAQGLLLGAAEVKHTRSFSLFRRSRSSTFRVSNSSTLVEEQITEGGSHGQNNKPRSGQLRSVGGRSEASMTSGEEASSGVALTGSVPGETPSASGLGISLTIQQPEAPTTKNKKARAAANQRQLGGMDTPEFIDAQEYVVSPASEEAAQSELSGALARVASPREEDGFSTAPSTPELSTGPSSPRHSVLITPECQRTQPGTKDPALHDHSPVSEPEDAVAPSLQAGATTPELKSKRSRDDYVVADEDPTHPTTAAKAKAPGDFPRRDTNPPQRASENPDPTARPVSRPQTPDNNTPTTNKPPPPTRPEPNTTAASPPSDTQLPTTSPLGAERPPAAAAAPAAATPASSDSPTRESEVRTSDPNDQQQPSLGAHDDASALPAFAAAAVGGGQCEVEASPSEPEACVSASEAPGSERGAGRGAEAASVGGCGTTEGSSDDAAALLVGGGGGGGGGPRGTESEAVVPSGREVVAEMGPKVSKSAAAGPEVDGGEGGVGDGDAGGGGGGPALAAEGPGKEFLVVVARKVGLGDVGSVEGTEGGCGLVDVDTRVPEVVGSEESTGPDSQTEGHVEPEGGILDESAPPADFSDPVVLPEPAHDAEPTAVDLVVPAPAGLATEGNIELGLTPNGPQVSSDRAGHSHAAGDSDSESPLKEVKQPAVSDLGSDPLPTGNGTKKEPGAVSVEPDATESPKQGSTGEVEEGVSVPVLGGLPGDVDGGAPEKSNNDAAGTEATGRDTLEGDEGEPIMDPIVTGTAETELPKLENTEEKSNTVPTVTLDGRNASEWAAEQSVTTPATPEVVKPEARNGVVGQVVEQELSQDVDSWSNGIGGEDAYESEEPRSDPRVGNDDAHKKAFGPEARIDETGASSEVGDRHVCADSGTPAPDAPGKHTAPAIPTDSLTPHGSKTSRSSTRSAQPSTPVNLSVHREALELLRNPASTQPAKPKPSLAPIPDLSKLPKSIPALSRISLSSDAASFPSPVRDSVDTIRPSVDESRTAKAPAAAAEQQPHTSSKSRRPPTAGYLHVGLHETHLVEVGLRGALGGVRPRRRRSMPLHNLLLLPDGEPDIRGRAGTTIAERSVSSGPAAKPDDPRRPLRRGMKKSAEEAEAEGGGGGGELDDGRSVLPRMMMLLAGAVAIGKMIKGPGD